MWAGMTEEVIPAHASFKTCPHGRKIMTVTLIAHTALAPGAIEAFSSGYEADGCSDGEQLVILAGRLCYASWSKPNPETATPSGYLKNIKDHRHFSVMEHANVSLLIEDVSRNEIYEFIRHRHFSYSQRSQRYVDENGAEISVPDLIRDNWIAPSSWDDGSGRDNVIIGDVFHEAIGAAFKGYEQLVNDLLPIVRAKMPDAKRFEHLKAARQAARAVLPGCTDTKILVTGNVRAWRHFLVMRGSEHADPAIRATAVECLHVLSALYPILFDDFKIREHFGSWVIESPYAEIS
jgi:thymidylate synthase (FAD)